MKAPQYIFALFLIVGSAAAQPADRENICPRLHVPQNQYAELYFRASDGTIKPISELTHEEIRGRRTHLCYVVSRSPFDVPLGVPQRGAINIKTESWEPDAPDYVGLFNNHVPENRLCKSRPFAIYQAFHETSALDFCLRYRFHNPFGDFSTFEHPDRRAAFLFSSLSLFQTLPVNTENFPTRRMSFIFNYAVPSDFSTIRIPFYFTIARDSVAVRITVDDLLETRFNQQLPRIRRFVKREQ